MYHFLSQPMPFVVMLLVLLLAARVLGEIMERIGQPAMIGEVLAGIILGPSVLNLIQPTSELKVIADLGVLLLVVVAGLEIKPEEIRDSVRGKNIWIAVFAFIIPSASGFLIGYWFNLSLLITIFLSLCISITALPVSVRILMDLGKLNTEIGKRIISAAIINDIIALLILGVILDINSNKGTIIEMTGSVIFTVLKVAGFTILIYLIYKLVQKARTQMPFINKQIILFLTLLRGRESIFALVIVFVLIFASFTEIIGLHFVVGAFFGALLISRENIGSKYYNQVKTSTNGITMGFLAPIFFAGIGVQFNLHAISDYWLLFVVLIASLASKMIGGYIGGMLAGLGRPASVTLGVGLNARGIMELVIANIALSNKFIDIALFSILVIMGLFTTLISPILMKRSFAMIDNLKK
jgi:Kef-type K+ transport system membrane component KefB